jgi:anti-sigma regulatory factor (Ser/Thr protein kinase)
MEPLAGWSHNVILAAEPKSVAVAREFVSRQLDQHDLPGLVADVRLVVSELATNAVTHARTPFIVTVSGVEGEVLLAVQDGCTSAPALSASGVLAMGGRGLLLVELLSEDWGTRTDGEALKSVWASFTSRPEQLQLHRA